jgi:hypothetical protein
MHRMLALAIGALAAVAGPVQAGDNSPYYDGKGVVLPSPRCPDCFGPCDKHRLVCVTLCPPEHVLKLLDDLHCDNARVRLRVVKKLGCRLHADFCAEPEVLDALAGALLCDSCWEVRRAAAWSILGQKARTETGVLALYLASKLDPHYMVRTRAAEALDILTVCRPTCWKELYQSADVLVSQLRAMDYRPGTPDCRVQLVSACSDCGIAPVVSPPPPTLPVLNGSYLRTGPVIPPGAESNILPAPKPAGKRQKLRIEN